MCAKRRIKQIKTLLAQLTVANRQWEQLLKEPLTVSLRKRLEDLIAQDQRYIYRLRLELYELESELLEQQQKPIRQSGRKSRNHDQKPETEVDKRTARAEREYCQGE
jgi:hypothetical protein